MTQYGQTPQVTHGGQSRGFERLFHSVRDIALVVDKTLKPGYGALRIGTVLAENLADGKLYPYPEAAAVNNNTNAKAFALADLADTDDEIFVQIAESYKFSVGDVLVIAADGETPQDLGAITAIDVADANGTRAKITVTTGVSGAAMTIANSAHVYLKGAAADPFTAAKYVLDQDTDTGTGEGSTGANTSVVLSNAVLYTSSLVGMDSAAKTDLGIIEDGRFTVLK